MRACEPVYPFDAYPGMTKRDHIALEAMKAMLGCQSFMNELARVVGSKEEARAELSRLAYAQADAMIEQSNKPQP